MESQHAALRTQIGSQKDEIQGLQGRIQELEAANRLLQNTNLHLESELREAESLRRKLHNEVQELRGNIRVFARVRPSVKNDANNSTSLASIRFPNEREANQIELLAMGESATGTATMRNHLFTFDRVFKPHTSQADVFEEVAHLTQSVLDGYNTCIFAYGQTGSGKTHTLEGGTELSLSTASDPSSDPHAVSSQGPCKCSGRRPRTSTTRAGGAGPCAYRNSTLTWLLKNSLGGNSKTLMLLALSPMAEHLNESLCSLRFASKVNSTVIGTAKKVKGASSD
ncbi:hypothetical protein L7F22_025697 [Adiantum nelumboides]|nr:hypothetical protein [Adiantum nelumboides]